jgi:hypothetical protein
MAFGYITKGSSRWIRLLFSREYPFEQMLVLWDTLFSVDPSLDLVDLICTSMLLRIRWECKSQHDYAEDEELTGIVQYSKLIIPSRFNCSSSIRHHRIPMGHTHL